MPLLNVQFGCGFSVGEDWLNFDSSPTLRIERLAVIGGLLSRLSGNRQLFPAAVRYGDITTGLPVAAGTVKALYASHVLEHLSYEDFRSALRQAHALLAPGGEFRLIVPDLEERARRYVAALDTGDIDAGGTFMRSCMLGTERRPKGAVNFFRQMIGGSAHLWMWDRASMAAHLEAAGFVDVRRCIIGDSPDPAFRQVEDASRFINKDGFSELAMSARKAG
jgi:hypothetical protein